MILRKGRVRSIDQKIACLWAGRQGCRRSPWAKGGPGARNKFTLAVLAGIKQAEEKLARPRRLDPDKPYECWDGVLIQQGLLFHWDTQELMPGQGPPPPTPARFDPGARRTEMTWRGRASCSKN